MTAEPSSAACAIRFSVTAARALSTAFQIADDDPEMSFSPSLSLSLTEFLSLSSFDGLSLSLCVSLCLFRCISVCLPLP